MKKVRPYCRYSEKGHRHVIADTVKKVRDTSLQTQLAFVNVGKKATKKKVRDNKITKRQTDRGSEKSHFNVSFIREAQSHSVHKPQLL